MGLAEVTTIFFSAPLMTALLAAIFLNETIGRHHIGVLIAIAGVFIVPMGYAVNLFLEIGPDFQHLRWDWQLPAWERGHLLILLGSIGMVGYMLLSRAYQIAPASLIAPFDYTYLPFATAMAYLVWAGVPAANTLIGMALIVGGGVRAGQSRRRARPPRGHRRRSCGLDGTAFVTEKLSPLDDVLRAFGKADSVRVSS